MGLHSGETYGGGQPATETEADEDTIDDSATLRPTFTRIPREADDTREADDDVDEPVEAPAAAEASEPATSAVASPPPAPVALSDLDQPLLSEDTGLLARWQLVQLGFIDDPRAAVAGAADLLEEAERALIEALRQRQRQMRTMWDHSPAAQGDTRADTEQLRQVMRRYQVLFNQLRQPV
jgi:hypothetical protein